MLHFLAVVACGPALVSCRTRKSIAAHYASLFKSSILSLELLDDDTDGKCIDGSPAGYYLRIAVSEKNQTATAIKEQPYKDGLSDNWILYLEGGCWCYNDIDCYLRSFEDLGSSKKYEKFLPDKFGGLLAKSGDSNFPFSTYNLVYVKYCDGNTFAGNRDEPVVVNGKPLYFRGKKIKERVLESLVKRTHFYDAQNIIVTGCSAGGLSSLIQADSISEWAAKNLRNGSQVDVASVPISGYFVDVPNVENKHVFRNQMIESYVLTNATSGLNEMCVRERKEMPASGMSNFPFYSKIFKDMPDSERTQLISDSSWRCNFAEYSFPHQKTRTFILNSSIDSYQRDCILSAMPVSEDRHERILRLTKRKDVSLQKTCDNINTYLNANGNCSAVEGFKHCGIDLTDCPMSKFKPLVEFQKTFLNRTLQAMNLSPSSVNVDGSIELRKDLPRAERHSHHGAFLTSCITHCEGKRDSSWDTIKIQGTSIRHAVLEWYFHTSRNPRSLDQFYDLQDNQIILKDKARTKVPSRRSDRVYVDCMLDEENYDECNASCIQ